jgi:23S rRNA (uracil1939-C5)-methyltransferase
METPETNAQSPEGRAPEAQPEPSLAIEKWVYGGQGLARRDGKAVMVSYVLPGERIVYRPLRLHPGWEEGEAAAIMEPSPERIEPACPVFGRCGGCHYQHAPAGYQAERKREILEEVFARVGKFKLPCEIGLLEGPAWEYRNRVQLHLAGGEIGYREAGSNRLCPIEGCPIAAPAINRALGELRAMARSPRWPRFVTGLELFTNGERVLLNVVSTEGRQRPARSFFAWCAERIPGADAGELDYPACGEIFRVSHGSFFQVNRFLIEPLVETALSAAEGDFALDLYAGVGLFSLPMARRFRQVAAIESSRSACRDLELNARRAGRAVICHQSAADAGLAGLETRPDFVLADPPRPGLGKSVVRELARLAPPRLTLVLCDPATGARDLAGLLAAGYRILKVTLIDLFPQTYHIETLVELGRGSSES